jgi:hypothetical protein
MRFDRRRRYQPPRRWPGSGWRRTRSCTSVRTRSRTSSGARVARAPRSSIPPRSMRGSGRASSSEPAWRGHHRYDWPLFISTVRRLQPAAVIFSDAGPDVRWVGNERGEGGATSWAFIDRARYVPGTDLSKVLTEGFRNAPDWVPPECDVSIRPGWFYRPTEDARVKTGSDLVSLYEGSVGRNCLLLLNVPPDPRGSDCRRRYPVDCRHAARARRAVP